MFLYLLVVFVNLTNVIPFKMYDLIYTKCLTVSVRRVISRERERCMSFTTTGQTNTRTSLMCPTHLHFNEILNRRSDNLMRFLHG